MNKGRYYVRPRTAHGYMAVCGECIEEQRTGFSQSPTMRLHSRLSVSLSYGLLFSIREAVLRSTREGGEEQVVSAQNDAQYTRP